MSAATTESKSSEEDKITINFNKVTINSSQDTTGTLKKPYRDIMAKP